MTQFLDWLGYGFLKAVTSFFNVLPPRLAIGIGSTLGRVSFYISSRRRVAYADLKAALGDRFNEKERWKVVRDHYAHLGAMLVEVLRVRTFDLDHLDELMMIHHRERFFEAIEKGKGVVLLTAHFGNWELLQIVSGVLGKPVHVLAREQRHFRLYQFLNELRESQGSVTVPRGFGIRIFLKALRKNELVGVLGDQDAGRDGGTIVRFFGRKTTMPTGAFELANRTGSPVLPSFMRRCKGPYHEIYVEPPLLSDIRDEKRKIETQVQAYTHLLEKWISRFPDQWLWASKRWKYTWTKRLLVLSDGKPGHFKQAKALASQFFHLKDQYGRLGMEYPVQVLTVKFRSGFHRFIFLMICPFLLPSIQGRLRFLRFFLEDETAREIVSTSTDFVISAGAHLAPLNLCLARDSKAKSIVLMKPSFPFSMYRYDLAVIPEHDRGWIPKKGLRLVLTPSEIDQQKLEESSDLIKKDLRTPSKIKMGVFLGGPTRRFKMELSGIEKLCASLERVSKKTGDYLVTTSRRTPDFISSYLRDKISRDPSCQMLVVAKQDSRPEVAPGMMGLADILVITEDSLSMISEAVSAGKKVIILNLDTPNLPRKHRHFQELLVRKQAVVTASPDSLERVIENMGKVEVSQLAQKEAEILRTKLREIL